MKKFAVIVAGGSGQRMNSAVPKQFMLLQGKPLVWHAINAFLSAYEDLQVILVLPAVHLQAAEKIRRSFLAEETRIFPVAGGESRFQSVKNGLALVTDPSIVFVHDGVRCLVTPDLITRCYTQALEKGSAIPAVRATDSIRIITADSHRVADRNDVRIIQTPQTFQSQLLLPAFDREYDESFTDEATVVEAAGHRVWLIEGEHENLKITRPADLLIAETILQERSSLQ
ncbi:MAG: 2-C-methyl-D-erythritol 4-phosphate cytidylyltransferase [Chitinophagaceae bacterium]|nr:2-C-methyl-D-erythritol 4-phosphate cytidylyltransferase [Chitinophagaceae bacterium]